MQRSDTVMKQVMADFERESHLKLQHHSVHIRAGDGALTVEGEVPDIACKKRLVHLTRLHGDGAPVIDQLRVAANPPVGDGELRTHVCERLMQAVDFRNCVICARVKGQLDMLRGTMDQAGDEGSGVIEVTVEGGVVTLTGQVISLSHRRLAGMLAWWVGGCRDVVNLLESMPAEWDGDDEISPRARSRSARARRADRHRCAQQQDHAVGPGGDQSREPAGGAGRLVSGLHRRRRQPYRSAGLMHASRIAWSVRPSRL
jgi:hypothetical protein